MAVAPSASPRNSRSIRTAAPCWDAATLTVVIGAPKRRSGSEAKGLLQIVPLRARRFNRTVSVTGPFHHRTGIELRVLPAQQLVEHEPVGRSPVAGVAIVHNRTGRSGVCDCGKFRLRLQAIGLRIVKFGAVDV